MNAKRQSSRITGNYSTPNRNLDQNEEDTLGKIRQFLVTSGFDNDNDIVTPTKGSKSNNNDSKTVEAAEKGLEKRFSYTNISPTKKARIDAEYTQAAKNRVKRQKQGLNEPKDLDVFCAYHFQEKNKYTKKLKRDQGWYLFMCDNMTRNWFFSERVFYNFDKTMYPRVTETALKWIGLELSREADDWMRSGYAEAWKLVIGQAVKKHELNWDNGIKIAKELLIRAGASREFFDLHQLELNEGLVETRFSLSERENFHIVETAVDCTGFLLSCLMQKYYSDNNILDAFRLLALCGADCVLSASGSMIVADQLVKLIDSLGTRWGEVEGQVLKMMIDYLPSDVLRLRMIEVLKTAKMSSKVVGGLYQRFALTSFFNSSDESIDKIDEILVNRIIVMLEKDEVYLNIQSKEYMKRNLFSNQERLKIKFLHLKYALEGLSMASGSEFYDNNNFNNNKRQNGNKSFVARQKLYRYVHRIDTRANELDPADQYFTGLRDACTQLQALIQRKFIEKIDDIA